MENIYVLNFIAEALGGCFEIPLVKHTIIFAFNIYFYTGRRKTSLDTFSFLLLFQSVKIATRTIPKEFQTTITMVSAEKHKWSLQREYCGIEWGFLFVEMWETN